MGSRHFSDLLHRPATLGRISIPRPSASTRCLRISQPSPWALASTQRHLNTSTPKQVERSRPGETAPLDTSADNSSELTSEIDQLFGYAKPSKPSPLRGVGLKGDSSDEFGAARRMFGANFSKPGINSGLRPRGLQFDDMMLPDEPSEPTQIIPVPEEDIKYPRLNASYGRTVNLDVERGRDIVRGINMLGTMMARNKVKADFAKQKYHERPGLKRKRLHSERWRANFRVGFDGMVGRVQELTRKGW